MTRLSDTQNREDRLLNVAQAALRDSNFARCLQFPNELQVTLSCSEARLGDSKSSSGTQINWAKPISVVLLWEEPCSHFKHAFYEQLRDDSELQIAWRWSRPWETSPSKYRDWERLRPRQVARRTEDVARWILTLECSELENKEVEDGQHFIFVRLYQMGERFDFQITQGFYTWEAEEFDSRRQDLWNLWFSFFSTQLVSVSLPPVKGAMAASPYWQLRAQIEPCSFRERLETLTKLNDWLENDVGLTPVEIENLLGSHTNCP